MTGSPVILTKLDDNVEVIPDSKNVRLSIELTPAEQERMGLLTERLGMRHPDDIIRYCIAQVTWWVLSGPMSTAALQEALSSNSNKTPDKHHHQTIEQRNAYQ